MEELRPQELEELLEELKAESDEEETQSPEVEKLLRDLRPARGFMLRLRAARQLGRIRKSSHQVVLALLAAAETDDAAKVRAAAEESLRAAVHQEILRDCPGLIRRAHSGTEQTATQRGGQAAAAESALQQGLDLREMARGAFVQRRIYPGLRIRERSPVARIVGIVIAVGSIAWIVAGALPAYKSDYRAGLLVTVVCGGFACAGFCAIGLDPLEIIRALLHRREWRGPQACTNGRIVDLEFEEFQDDEGHVFFRRWTTFAFSGTGGLVYLKTTIDQSTFHRLRRGDPVKVRYAVENPQLAILEWESGW